MVGKVRQSIVSTIPHDLHRRRRAPMGKYFSKSNIRRLDSTIQENLAKFLERLENSRSSQEVIPLTHAFRALTCDIITSYSFGACSDFLSREDYNGPLWEAVYSSTKLGHWIEHIGWLGPLIEALPKQVIASMSPGWGSLSRLEDVSFPHLAVPTLQLIAFSNGTSRSEEFKNQRVTKTLGTAKRPSFMACSTAISLTPRRQPLDCTKKPAFCS